jgi:alkyldihydroxyacetonephosphate synthase
VATRSSGQQSLGYGRIEQLLAAARVQTPVGPWELPSFPASAAGPDLRHLLLGSEGRLGVITEATVRVTPVPERELFTAIFFPNWEQGVGAVRQIAQAKLPVSMLRLSTAMETEASLALAGHRLAVSALQQLLGLRGLGETKCMLVIGLAGAAALVKTTRRAVLGIAEAHRGVHLGRPLGQAWAKNRFRAPYLRNTLWEHGYAVDTLETAADWHRLPDLLPSCPPSSRPCAAPSPPRTSACTSSATSRTSIHRARASMSRTSSASRPMRR